MVIRINLKPLKIFVLIVALLCSFLALNSNSKVLAAVTCSDGKVVPGSIAKGGQSEIDAYCGTNKATTPAANRTKCDPKLNVCAVDDPALTCAVGNQKSNTATQSSNNCPQDFFGKYLLPLINLLSGLVGIIVVILVVVGGIRYSAAGGDPNKVQAAKKQVINALLALVAYIFLYAFLEWIIPGGLFS